VGAAGCGIPGPEVIGGCGGGGGAGGGGGRTIRSRSRSPFIGFALGLAGTELGIRGALGGDIVIVGPCPCIGCVASNSCGVLGWEWERGGGADGGVGETIRPGRARERTGEPCGVPPPPPCWEVCGGGGSGGCEGGWTDSLNDPRDGRGGADGASGALKGVIIRSWGPAGGGPEAGLPRSLSLSLSR
jgi:hypothetical protein